MPKGKYKRTKEAREKLSSEMKKRWKNPEFRKKAKMKGLKGSDNPNWKGGVGRRGTDAWWRKQILERDSYTCQKCGLKEHLIGFMQVDHIRPKKIFPEFKYDMDNGRTLCPNCHRRKSIADDSIYGFFSKKHIKK